MSSTAITAPQAAGPTRARHRRPSTLTVYRWELRKLMSQKRTYLGLALAIAPPLIFVVVENVHQRPHHGGGESIFAAQIMQSGLATPVLMLTFMSLFLLPLVATLVAGDIVANEDGNGTLKTVLTRSVNRGQVLAAKFLAACSYALLAVFLSAAIGTAAGVASWGYHSVTSLSGTVVPPGEALLLIFASNAIYMIPLLAIVSIGVLLSAATRNSAAAVVATIGSVIVIDIIAGIPGLEGARPYLLTQQFEACRACCARPPTGHRSRTLRGCARYMRCRLCSRPTSCSCAATWPAVRAAPRASADARARARAPRPPERAPLAHLGAGRQLHVGELDVAHQPARLARVDEAGAQARRGLGAARDPEAQALVGGAPFVARGEIAGEEGVAGAGLADRLAVRHARFTRRRPSRTICA